MSKLFNYETEDGKTIMVETVGGSGGAKLVSSDLPQQTQKLSAALSGIAPFLLEIKKMIDAVERPGETTVELNIGFSATAGAFVASGEANASIKITLAWK